MFRPAPLIALLTPLALAACNPAEPSSQSGADGASSRASAAGAPAPQTPEAAGGADEESAVPATSPDASDGCGAAAVRERWLNALPSADAKAAIAAAVGDRPIRYYSEGDVVTMDFRDDRLNVILGKDGRIKEFRCG